MTDPTSQPTSNWCIVIADDHGPEWAPTLSAEENGRPVQYCRLGESTTLLQRALHRAARLAPPSQILVTANEDYRHLWEPLLRCIQPAQRFVCEQRAASMLTLAAAILTVAENSTSNIVTILPARCHVRHAWILKAACDHALAILPRVTEGVVTMGMLDLDESLDEDYLVAHDAGSGPGLSVQGIARRPMPWIARHLREQGALIASGILIGYAGAFAAHITKHWPGLTLELTRLVSAASRAGVESDIPCDLLRGIPSPVVGSLRWYPPSFPQRVFCVRNAGWSGLHSARAVARLSRFQSGFRPDTGDYSIRVNAFRRELADYEAMM